MDVVVQILYLDVSSHDHLFQKRSVFVATIHLFCIVTLLLNTFNHRVRVDAINFVFINITFDQVTVVEHHVFIYFG